MTTAADTDLLVLRPGDDFAMAFCMDGKYVWLIGRCNQLFQKRGRKKWELREVSGVKRVGQTLTLACRLR